jgi:hypothetical protein
MIRQTRNNIFPLEPLGEQTKMSKGLEKGLERMPNKNIWNISYCKHTFIFNVFWVDSWPRPKSNRRGKSRKEKSNKFSDLPLLVA